MSEELCPDCSHPKPTHYMNNNYCVVPDLNNKECGCTNVFEIDPLFLESLNIDEIPEEIFNNLNNN